MYCVQVSGVLHNTGQSLVFRPETGPKHSLAVNVSAGPLAYRYQIEEVFLHYGTDNSHGSEHRIQGSAFPAEVKRNPPLLFFLLFPYSFRSNHALFFALHRPGLFYFFFQIPRKLFLI